MKKTTTKRARIASGYWHGEDCYVLSRDHGTPECILVGGYTEEEALKVRKLLKEDKRLGRYEDNIVYITDPSEWREQNS